MIFKSKKYKFIENNNKVLFSQNSYLRKMYANEQKENQKNIKELAEAKKEIKRLKQLLTRNNIKYKKES